MKSHDSPRSTSASTSATKTRVPLNVTCPWQIFASATMYWPSSIRSDDVSPVIGDLNRLPLFHQCQYIVEVRLQLTHCDCLHLEPIMLSGCYSVKSVSSQKRFVFFISSR